jgi:pimeloyl-ACP methyl ester carboxylesterase
MSRRAFLQTCIALGALGALGALPAQAGAAPAFSSSRISVEVRGTGPDVVLIPGMTASPAIWNGTVAAVPGYRYHLVHVAGFGGAPARGNARGPVAGPVADEIARYIREARLARPALVGHSMGGSLAMMVAARHEGAAARLMVVDMVPAPAQLFGVSARTLSPLARLLGSEIAATDRLRRDLQAAIGRFGSADWLETNSDGGVVGRSMQDLLAADLTPELPRIAAPMTVVYACPEPLRLTRARLDGFYAKAYAARPGTRLIAVERSGHTIMHDQPRIFQAALKAFLR